MENINNEIKNSEQENKQGLMIASIVTFAIGLIFFILTMLYAFKTIFLVEGSKKALGFVAFLLTYGWMTFIPSLIFSIIGLCTSRFGLKSYSKNIKKVCISFVVLNAVLLVSTVILGMFIILVPYIL